MPNWMSQLHIVKVATIIDAVMTQASSHESEHSITTRIKVDL